MQTQSNRLEEKHKKAKFEKHLKLSMFIIFHTPLIVANRGGLPSAQEGAVGV